jgi:hypothetical protein
MSVNMLSIYGHASRSIIFFISIVRNLYILAYFMSVPRSNIKNYCSTIFISKESVESPAGI